MALIFMDGCDQHSNSTDVAMRWNYSVAGNVVQSNGPWSEQSISLNTRGDRDLQTAFGPKKEYGDVVYTAFWQRMGPSNSGRRGWIQYHNSNGFEGGTYAWDGFAYTIFADNMGCIWGHANEWTTAPVLTFYRWQWVEIAFTFHNSAGAVQIYVDGTQVVNETGLDTNRDAGGNDSLGAISYASQGRIPTDNADKHSYNDVIVWDDSGSNINTFPLGPQRVATLRPDAEGTTIQFTPQTGTDNSAMVDEVGGADVSTYNESSTVGHIDMYTVDNLAFTPTTVNAVQVSAQVEATSTTDREFKLKADDGTTIGASGDMQTPNGGTEYWQNHIWELNPTGAAWTETTVNGMEIGIEVVT